MRASYLHFERQYDAVNVGAMKLDDFEFSDEKTCPNLDSVLTAYFAGAPAVLSKQKQGRVRATTTTINQTLTNLIDNEDLSTY